MLAIMDGYSILNYCLFGIFVVVKAMNRLHPRKFGVITLQPFFQVSIMSPIDYRVNDISRSIVNNFRPYQRQK